MAIDAKATRVILNRIMYLSAVILMPSILLFYLYNNNRVQNHLIFYQVIILAGIFAIAGLILYLLFIFIAKGEEAALLLSLCFWICFWFFRDLYGYMSIYVTTMSATLLLIIICVVLFFIAIVFRNYEPSFMKVKSIFQALSVSLILLFVFNFIPGLSFNITLYRAKADSDLLSYSIKQDFIISNRLPQPDIYWIHVDGMMSMDTVERFWGESQEYLRDELSRKGFVVYANAELNGGYTNAALAAILSPTLYDSFLSDAINRHDTLFRHDRTEKITEELAQVGLEYYEDIAPYFELLVALATKGYDMSAYPNPLYINELMEITYEANEYIFDRWHVSLFGDLPKLLTLTTPLNIIPKPKSVLLEEQKQEDDSQETPCFFWHYILQAHILHWQNDTELLEENIRAIHLYPVAYERAAQEMLHFIDEVLLINPNAVIILQGDHGFHHNDTQQFLLDQGHSLDQVLELIHSVFSAVRIPAAYGGVDEPIAPLNIARVLVNRFVGQNYRLLIS
ncbi:MAG: hypothetical protein FWD44_01790 [Oscillospiraceae bacterium]|nr:hypothetical protein [Oscillospiraceae bacterium]